MPASLSSLSSDRHLAVRIWLGAVALMIALTAIVGAATRLTGSGLSITEWAPIMGVLPPMSDTQWQEAFAKYREIPQYKLVNKGMSLDAFKTIFWWEWGHRILARSIGVVFLIPFVVFLARRALPRRIVPLLCGLFLLGALQGFVGWYMVSSGLADRVDVSQYRLALHLGLAVAIFALIVGTIFALSPDAEAIDLATETSADLKIAWALTLAIYVQVLLGALVAGLKAGKTYNTWPLMDGALIPDGLFALKPAWLNVFENAALVQFNHRVIAYAILALALWHAVRLTKRSDNRQVRNSAVVLAALVLSQVALGIWTLLAWVPVSLGVAHQAGALILLAAAVWHLMVIRRTVSR